MCGIIGAIGNKKTLETVVSGLQRLEYRGYDSFGVSVVSDGVLSTKKSVGSVSAHAKKGFFDNVLEGESAIAHTRWATHGGVTVQNAHPHVSYDGAFSIVHNGVIENYQTLKKQLQKSGVTFLSETDTEVIAHLIAKNFEKKKDVYAAFIATLAQLTGEYAIVCSTTHDPDHVYASRVKSPLGFGHAEGMGIVASDQRALSPLTPLITFLEDYDVLVLSRGEGIVHAPRSHGVYAKVRRSVTTLPYSGDDSGLEGYAHHMLKEIHEIPVSAERIFAMKDVQFANVVADIAKKKLSITGAGSAYYVAQIGQYYFSHLAHVSSYVHPSDEIVALSHFSKKDHLIAVSQSGETFDTMEAMRAVLASGGVVTAINNVLGSSSNRLATYPLFQGSGTEVCVCSTKSIISQSLMLYRLAKQLGRANDTLSVKEYTRLTKDEKLFVPAVEAVFATLEKKIKKIAEQNAKIHDWFFIGRGLHYPVAMESALKWKEITYAHAEGMPAGFFKHGTISLIDKNFYTVAFLPSRVHDESLFKFTASNIAEIRARGGHVIAIGHDADVSDEIGELHEYIALPSINRYFDPLLELVAGQLLAYYCALSLGREIDKPRALAKAVTVR